MKNPRYLIGSTEAARRAGITYRQLNYWLMRDAIVPEVRGIGSGSRTYWTPLQVEHLRVLGRVREHFSILMAIDRDTAGGIATDRLRRAWDALESGRPWGFGIFIRADGTLDLVTPDSLDLAS